MTETEKARPLFRPEAVEHHLRGRVTGRTLDLRERRTVWLFRGLLVAILVGVLLSLLIRVDTYASGQVAVTPDGLFADTAVTGIDPGATVVVRVSDREVAGRVADADSEGARIALAEQVPAGLHGTATIARGDASVLFLLLGWD